MSSKYVRDNILQYLQDETSENIIDLTAEFQDVHDMVEANSLTVNDPWLGVQFVPSEEIPVDVSATNTKGKYREIGVILLHIVAVSSIGVHNSILTRAETVRDVFRGKRIADSIIITQVSPAAFGESVTLNFEGGYTAGAVTLFYQRDLDL
ncbi:MAG: hypothetical protein VKL41_05100 [Snowella sp.]|jgi:hypothetical protein|nr:hypothetical protein [Snowella sp.]